MPRSLQNLVTAILGLSPDVQLKLAGSLAGLIVLVILRSVALRLVNRRIEDAKALYIWRKSITYATFALAVLVLARPWFPALSNLSTFLGIVSAGLAIALQDPIVNLAGWVFILWRRPFQVGDRIQIGEIPGDVIDLRIFQFTLLEIGNWVDADQSTGRDHPRAQRRRSSRETAGQLQQAASSTSGTRSRSSSRSRATGRRPRTSWWRSRAPRRAPSAEPSEQAARGGAALHDLLSQSSTPIVYTSVHDSGVLLTVRYLCEPRGRRAAEQAIWEDILTRSPPCDDIDFAYPTQRFYDNRGEGKPEARAKP